MFHQPFQGKVLYAKHRQDWRMSTRTFVHHILNHEGRLAGDLIFWRLCYSCLVKSNRIKRSVKRKAGMDLKGGKTMGSNWLNGVMGVVVGDALGCPV